MTFFRRRRSRSPADTQGERPPEEKASEAVASGSEPSSSRGKDREAALDQGKDDAAPAQGSDVLMARRTGTRSKRKWALLGAVAVLALGAAALMAGTLRLSVPWCWTSSLLDRDPPSGTVREEHLDPFFLPLSEGGETLALRLDVLVRWDRATAARFKKEAPWIRARLYEGLLDRFQDDATVSEKRDLLEEEIGKALRRLLGDKDIRIVLERIKVI